MARIAVIVSNPCTGDARVIKMAQAAHAAGHEVHIFATQGLGSKHFETKRGITYHRLEWKMGRALMAYWPLKLVGLLSRPFARLLAMGMTPYAKYAVFRDIFASEVAKFKPDIIHAHDLICLPAGHAAAEMCGAKLVYDAHELEVHRNPPLSWLQKRKVARTERKYARKADAVITVGRFVGKEIAEHVGLKNINIMYNSPVIADCPNNIRTDIGLDDETPLMLYVGKVTQGRGIQLMLDLLPKLPGVVLAAVGPSAPGAKEELEEIAMKMGLFNRFHILPPVPPSQVVNYIKGANIGVISVQPVTLSYQYCMPNKLFEMSFADIPIISNKLDEIEEFIEEFGNGVVCDFESDAHYMSYYISKMIQSSSDYKLSSFSKVRMNSKYSWATQSNKLMSLYSELIWDSSRGDEPSS
ncbi:MAG: glycosyltransferase family 4 protein [Pikeienuella sp.]